MYKNLEEFKKDYYPSKEYMERYALENVMRYHCNYKCITRYTNALIRAGIDNIEKFVNADIDDILKVNHIGEKGIEELMKARMYIKHSVEEL